MKNKTLISHFTGSRRHSTAICTIVTRSHTLLCWYQHFAVLSLPAAMRPVSWHRHTSTWPRVDESPRAQHAALASKDANYTASWSAHIRTISRITLCWNSAKLCHHRRVEVQDMLWFRVSSVITARSTHIQWRMLSMERRNGGNRHRYRVEWSSMRWTWRSTLDRWEEFFVVFCLWGLFVCYQSSQRFSSDLQSRVVDVTSQWVACGDLRLAWKLITEFRIR